MKNGTPESAEISPCPAILYGIVFGASEHTSEERISKSRRVFVPLFI
jgi:hypothetical protein